MANHGRSGRGHRTSRTPQGDTAGYPTLSCRSICEPSGSSFPGLPTSVSLPPALLPTTPANSNAQHRPRFLPHPPPRPALTDTGSRPLPYTARHCWFCLCLARRLLFRLASPSSPPIHGGQPVTGPFCCTPRRPARPRRPRHRQPLMDPRDQTFMTIHSMSPDTGREIPPTHCWAG